MATEVHIDDLARALEHAQIQSEALLEALRALQRAVPADHEKPASDLKEALTNVIIMRTRLNERQSVLPELLRAATEDGMAPILVPEEVAERLGFM